MLATVDITSWYGVVAGIAVVYLLWAAVLDTGHRHVRAVKRRWPEHRQRRRRR